MRILIAGGGEVASLVARRLAREGNEIVIVEQSEERCIQLDQTLDARIVRGSAASVRTLREAGLADAEMIIAVTDRDEINMLACLAAQTESDVRVKVARFRTHEIEDWRRICRQAGLRIDLIIHPESAVVARMLPVLPMPGVSEILSFASGAVQLFGIAVEEGSWVSGKTMEELDRAGPPRNSLVAMVFRGSQVIIPRGGDTLDEGDFAYILTRAADLEEDLRFMGLPGRSTLERVFIFGGRQVGILAAELLEKEGVSVKLFEQDGERCDKISRILEDTVVIHGDGSDEATLLEANIEGVDAFLALTAHDEDNIIAALLARRLGARKVVALVERPNYLSMAQRLGIHTVVSSRLVAVDGILQFVRKGRVLSVTTFREEAAEAIELLATPRSPYVGRKLRDVRLPRGAIVGAIARPSGEVVVPRGEASIQPGDRVIFFTLEGAVAKLESAFLAEPRRERV